MKSQDIDHFLGLPKGSFDHIPLYAKNAVLEAIARVRALEEKSLFRPGLYYIALADLCGSTISSRHLGDRVNKMRIQAFITAAVEALGRVELKNYAQFLKEVGDGTLFIFSSFDDAFAWWNCFEETLSGYNQDISSPHEDDHCFMVMKSKTIFHAREISYLGAPNPVSLAVNQVFKIEKFFKPGQLGCTDVVRRAAVAQINERKLKPIKNRTARLPGDSAKSDTWVLATSKWT